MEAGLLDLDAPAKEYIPAIGDLQVLDGFDDAGHPVLRAPKRDITTRMLLLHTAGFGYDFFNEDYARLVNDHGQPSVITATILAIAGSTARTSIGPARWSRRSPGSDSVMSCANASSSPSA